MFRLPQEDLSPLSRVILTTGQVAKIARVAPRTVGKWVDGGLIEGSYRIPGSTDRRIPAIALRKFMQANNMSHLLPPTWGCEVLFVDVPQPVQVGVQYSIRHILPEDSTHIRYRMTGGAMAVAYATLYQPLLIFTSLAVSKEVLSVLRQAVKLPANGGDTFVATLVTDDDGVSWADAPARYPGVDYGLPAHKYNDTEPTATAIEQITTVLYAARDRWQKA